MPSGSEWIERAPPFVRSDVTRAREILDELRAEQPDSPAVPILNALLAAGQGNGQAAKAELAAVLSRGSALREPLRSDPDLGPLLPD